MAVILFNPNSYVAYDSSKSNQIEYLSENRTQVFTIFSRILLPLSYLWLIRTLAKWQLKLG